MEQILGPKYKFITSVSSRPQVPPNDKDFWKRLNIINFKGLAAMKIKCPVCGCADVRKYGKTKAGRQRYRCLRVHCRRQFVSGATDHLIKPAIKALALSLIEAKIDPRKIQEVIKLSAASGLGISPFPQRGRSQISLRWIYRLRQRVNNDKKS